MYPYPYGGVSGYYQPSPIMTPSPAPVPPAAINWVMGKEGAKAFPVAAGQSVLLMDSEGSRFFIKTVDEQGFAMLRSYLFVAEEEQSTSSTPQMPIPTPPADYATKDDLHELAQQLLERLDAITLPKSSTPKPTNSPLALV